MKWLAPAHLEVTYDGGRASIEFQVVKYSGVEISVRDISGGSTGKEHEKR
jgi:hypothetical protein